ncbi:MAG: rod shape-determining protein MreC [Clostridia bacterium]|nr:rod shape-determining protein MreC [Clostridia bacterium]
MDRFFLKRRSFKCLVLILSFLIIISTVSGLIGMWMEPQSTLLGAVVTPIQRFATYIGDSVSEFFATYHYNDQLREENEKLKTQLNETTQNLIDFDAYRSENEFLREFLEIKKSNEDYEMASATVIAVDFTDGNLSFTIDKGTLDGISLNDPVITAQGVVGYVTNIQATYSTVASLLSSNINVGAYATRTGEYGIVTSNPTLSADGYCRMNYLSSKTSIANGDYIITSGLGGLFPAGLVIGTVGEVRQDETSVSSYATIIPAADISDLKRVMILTSFASDEKQGEEVEIQQPVE